MLITKEELPVEVAEINGVQVDNVDFAEANKDEVLQELTANSSSTDHQNARLMDYSVSHVLAGRAQWTDLLDTRVQGTQRLTCKPITPHGGSGCLAVSVGVRKRKKYGREESKVRQTYTKGVTR